MNDLKLNRVSIITISLLLLFTSAPSVHCPAQRPALEVRTMRTITVNASGSGDYTHIQWAVDNASAGDTIVVEAGTYRENVVINKTLSLLGAGWENTTVDRQGNGDGFHIEANWVNVSGFNCANARFTDYGIALDNSNFCKVEANRMVDNGGGIYLQNSDNNQIINNICQDNYYRGIVLYTSFNNTFRNNTCMENREGIYVSFSSDNILDRNECLSNQYDGIELSVSHSNEIIYNNCSDNGMKGIDIDRSDNNSLRINDLQGNDVLDIDLLYSVDNEFSGNRMASGGFNFYGDRPEHWNTHDIGISNLVNGRPVAYFKNSSNGVIDENAGQIILAGCDKMVVKDQNISDVSTGIQVGYSNNIVIENNILSHNREVGIFLYNTSGALTRNNRCDSNGYCGIQLYSRSSYNELNNNSCSENSRDGIRIGYYSGNNKITRNNCSSNNDYGINVQNGAGNQVSNNIAYDNYRGISIYNSEGSLIRDNLCSSNYHYGICLDSLYCRLDNNTCDANDQAGIYITDNYNNITNNTCMINRNGIRVYGHATGNNITNNSCSSNSESGLLMDGNSDDNVVVNNTFLENLNGITIDYNSDENRLFDNLLIWNAEYGIEISGNSHSNLIANNAFIDNNGGGTQASDYCWGTEWYRNGSGNYWSDWTEPDSDYDGIVDSPYRIHGSVGSLDHFPLVNPQGILFPIADAGPDLFIDQHETVLFDSSGCLNRDHIIAYSWNFTHNGVEESLSGPSPSFIFRIPGTYRVNLTVRNILDQSTWDEVMVTVLDITPPVADAGPDMTADQHETVRFDGTGSSDNVGIANLSWSFIHDDLFHVLYGTNPDFVFHSPGVFPINLRVIDVEGNLDIDEVFVTVYDITPPRAFAGNDRTIRQHDTINLYGDSSRDNVDIVNYTWTYTYDGRNITRYGESVALTFHIPGRYVVKLTVCDARGNSDSDDVAITVEDRIPPEADAGGDVTIDPDNTVIFDASESSDNTGLVNYSWQFEYEGVSVHLTGQTSYFHFEKGGKYVVMLLVTDEHGNEDMDWLVVTVRELEVDMTQGSGPDAEYDFEIEFPEKEEEDRGMLYLYWGVSVLIFVVLTVILLAITHIRTDRKKDEDMLDEAEDDHRVVVGAVAVEAVVRDETGVEGEG